MPDLHRIGNDTEEWVEKKARNELHTDVRIEQLADWTFWVVRAVS